MRKAVWILLFAFMATTGWAESPKEGSLGVGGMVGSIGSISVKYFATDEAALDFGVEYLDHPWTVIYGDFFWHIPGLFGKTSKFGRESSFYVGGGGGAGFWDRTDNCGRWNCTWSKASTASGTGTGFFIRIMIGVEWYPLHTPLGVFAEGGPSYMAFPSAGSTVDAAVGGRFYF